MAAVLEAVSEGTKRAEEAQDTPVEKGGNPETQEEPKIGDSEQSEKTAKVGEDRVNKDKDKKVKKMVRNENGELVLDHRKLFKQGQKFLTPPVSDPTRGFYESLYKENPKSRVAIKFSVEHGLLPIDEHRKLYKRFLLLKEAGAYDTRAPARLLEARKLAKLERRRSNGGEKDQNGDKKEKKEKRNSV
mmetsp:Transcript_47818/g.126574  ORF Transcript_47818/g.126574 Transcript_47818/m.126574 type:complete len:188 (-) Transcript_47818:224-787(-)